MAFFIHAIVMISHGFDLCRARARLLFACDFDGSALCSSTWRKEARLIEPRPMVGLNVLELQTAKEILAEVFHTRPDLGFDFRHQHES